MLATRLHFLLASLLFLFCTLSSPSLPLSPLSVVSRSSVGAVMNPALLGQLVPVPRDLLNILTGFLLSFLAPPVFLTCSTLGLEMPFRIWFALDALVTRPPALGGLSVPLIRILLPRWMLNVRGDPGKAKGLVESGYVESDTES